MKIPFGDKFIVELVKISNKEHSKRKTTKNTFKSCAVVFTKGVVLRWPEQSTQNKRTQK